MRHLHHGRSCDQEDRFSLMEDRYRPISSGPRCMPQSYSYQQVRCRQDKPPANSVGAPIPIIWKHLVFPVYLKRDVHMMFARGMLSEQSCDSNFFVEYSRVRGKTIRLQSEPCAARESRPTAPSRNDSAQTSRWNCRLATLVPRTFLKC